MSPAGNHVKALGLILSFRETDIDQLARENIQVRKCLESLGFEVQVIEFEASRYKQSLCAFLNAKKRPGPRLIYINGHGGETKTGQPSHRNGDWDSKVIPWPTLLDLIGSAECDVLTILDCCNAGLAIASSLKREHIKNLHAKELIAAGAWGNTTADRLAPAVCEALQAWCKNSVSRQAASLFRTLMTIIKRMRDEAVREKLKSLKEAEDSHRRSADTASRLRKKAEDIEAKKEKELEKAMKGLSLQDPSATKPLLRLDKNLDSVWEDIAKQESRASEFKAKVKESRKQLKEIKESHPQPIHIQLNSLADPWTLKGGFYGVGGRKNRGGSVGGDY
ncbi:hypothetical protein V8F20_001820 [Naviculisporaceae sp. PSN 640]